jgi:hypothetical protein
MATKDTKTTETIKNAIVDMATDSGNKLSKQQQDNLLGKNLCPNYQLGSDRLESALAVLRNTELGAVTPAQGAEAQTTLYTTIAHMLVRRPEADSLDFLNNLLQYVEANLQVHFAPKLACRWFDHLTDLTEDQFSEFSMLLAILTDTAKSSTRLATAKSISWESVRLNFREQTAEEMLARLKKFYTIK